jgi:hypothetical protein
MRYHNFIYDDLHKSQILADNNNDILFIDIDAIIPKKTVSEEYYNFISRKEINCISILVLTYLYKFCYEGSKQMREIIPTLSISKEFQNYLIEATVNCSLTDSYIDSYMNELDEEKVKYDEHILIKRGIIKR